MDVRRPEPAPARLLDRWTQQLRSAAARLRSPATIDPDPAAQEPRAPLGDKPGPDPAALAFVTIAVVGVIITVFATTWAWQQWRSRSSVPIDDRLPTLVADPEATLDPAESNPPVSQASPVSPQPDGQPEQLMATTAVPVPEAAEAPAAPTPILVHVSGAVREPGVVELTDDARAHDAIAAAGGSTARADLDRLNLAAPVLDGDRLHVPAIGEGDPPEVLAPERSRAEPAPLTFETERQQPVDINTATTNELETLPGVGPATAAAIVELRAARGPYFSVEELLDVPGIGPTKLERMAPWVVVSAT